jgi:hypothetical protein
MLNVPLVISIVLDGPVHFTYYDRMHACRQESSLDKQRLMSKRQRKRRRRRRKTPAMTTSQPKNLAKQNLLATKEVAKQNLIAAEYVHIRTPTPIHIIIVTFTHAPANTHLHGCQHRHTQANTTPRHIHTCAH